ncbi:hypothetical protein RUND412_005934 [Rhizina undulata]
MSYAEVAASGPTQSPEESLVDVDKGVTVVPSDFLEREVFPLNPHKYPLNLLTPSQVKTETQAARISLEAAEAEARAAAAATSTPKSHKSKKHGKETIKSFAENPILAVNAATVAVLVAGVGCAAWRKAKVGELSWGFVGLWGAGVAAFGIADYALSTYLFKKYQSRK